MVNCPHCGRPNDEKNKLCTFCGRLIRPETTAAETRALPEDENEENIARYGDSKFTQRMNLLLDVRGHQTPLRVELNPQREIVLGRRDPITGDTPPIDLDPFDGVNKGVSRQHASILLKDNGSLHITDLSVNGTYLNGMKLIRNQPRILRDGDEIRLGHLVLGVKFERRT